MLPVHRPRRSQKGLPFPTTAPLQILSSSPDPPSHPSTASSVRGLCKSCALLALDPCAPGNTATAVPDAPGLLTEAGRPQGSATWMTGGQDNDNSSRAPTRAGGEGWGVGGGSHGNGPSGSRGPGSPARRLPLYARAVGRGLEGLAGETREGAPGADGGPRAVVQGEHTTQ